MWALVGSALSCTGVYGYVLLSLNMMEVLNLSQQGVSVLPVRQKPQGSVNKAPSLGGSLRGDERLV